MKPLISVTSLCVLMRKNVRKLQIGKNICVAAKYVLFFLDASITK